MRKPKRVHRFALLVVGALAAWLVAVGKPSPDEDQPTIVKDSVQVTLVQSNGDQGWWPWIRYKVNGPIASGSQLYVEFAVPGKPWSRFDCKTGEIPKGHRWHVDCGVNSTGMEKPSALSTMVGPVGFQIKLRNELAGTDLTLFKGKAKLGKSPGKLGPYYVDEDWRIPIGYVYYEKDNSHGGETYLHVGFWYRGNPPDIEAHLFYQGKDIAKFKQAGNGAGDYKPSKPQWGYADCQFLGVYPTEPAEGQGYDPRFGIKSHPGDYEVKVLIVGHLARSIKFKVDADGQFDNGIGKANDLGINHVIVPVKVVGNAETWDKAAWKTGAYYGNPLTGFTPEP